MSPKEKKRKENEDAPQLRPTEIQEHYLFRKTKGENVVVVLKRRKCPHNPPWGGHT